MMSSYHRMSRRLLVAAAALALAAAPLGTATAEPSDPGNHTMGSQIRKHEGTRSAPTQGQIADAATTSAVVYGIDVASYQGNVDWAYWWNQGKRFVWVKATEGTGYTNPYFGQQYGGSYNKGFIRGAYHFALPNRSGGAAQAKYFSDHGGGWSGDGRTLPGALDMEYNPYGATCYGMTKTQLRTWVRDFVNYYKGRWGKYPAIYTSTSWWNQCVSGDFHTTNPLWVARYSSSVGTLPYNWGVWTVWQYSSAGNMDKNAFNGTLDRLKVFATARD